MQFLSDRNVLRITFLSGHKGVNPGGREEGIGGCAVYQHKGSKSGCQCEECTRLNSCPGHIRGITDSVFP